MASLQYLLAAYSEATSRQLIGLLTLSGGGLPVTLRYTTDFVGMSSRGNIFAPLFWDIRLPSIEGAQLRQGELTLDNTSEQPIASLRTATAPVSTLLELVLAPTDSDPSAHDRVEYSARWQIVPDIQYSASEIRCRLGAATILEDSYPGKRFSPGAWPGIFSLLFMIATAIV